MTQLISRNNARSHHAKKQSTVSGNCSRINESTRARKLINTSKDCHYVSHRIGERPWRSSSQPTRLKRTDEKSMLICTQESASSLI